MKARRKDFGQLINGSSCRTDPSAGRVLLIPNAVGGPVDVEAPADFDLVVGEFQSEQLAGAFGEGVQQRTTGRGRDHVDVKCVCLLVDFVQQAEIDDIDSGFGIDELGKRAFNFKKSGFDGAHGDENWWFES